MYTDFVEKASASPASTPILKTSISVKPSTLKLNVRSPLLLVMDRLSTCAHTDTLNKWQLSINRISHFCFVVLIFFMFVTSAYMWYIFIFTGSFYRQPQSHWSNTDEYSVKLLFLNTEMKIKAQTMCIIDGRYCISQCHHLFQYGCNH